MDMGALIILGIVAVIGLFLLKSLVKMLLFASIVVAGIYFAAKAGYLPDSASHAVLNSFSFFEKLDVSGLIDKLSALLDKIKELGGVLS
ncbi:hypothetical protein [Thermococcus sp.]|uniref:hypothetical protein n=1 Tax=Thermococcus sp. TaxID=35749 RepID=UPI002618C654|nr:hypothetical protein [Thermococcus sp.]